MEPASNLLELRFSFGKDRKRPDKFGVREFIRGIQDQSRRLRLRWRIRQARTKANAVLVYQMGKVASSSIQATLRAAGVNSFHVHLLEPVAISEAIRECDRRNRLLPRRLEQSILLSEQIIEPHVPMKVISLVREPIARTISAYFERLDDIWRVQSASQKLSIETLITGYMERGPHDDTLFWFDREFAKALSTDIYQFPFSRKEGVAQFRSGAYEVMILRTDLEDGMKVEHLKQFLNLKRLNWIQKNISDDSSRAAAYRQFRDAIRLPADYVERMLNSRFARHFFTDAEIERYAVRWKREK